MSAPLVVSACALAGALAAPLLFVPSEPLAAAPGGNQPPVCVVEIDGQVVTGAVYEVPYFGATTSVDVSACGSFDPDGDPLTFQWVGCAGVTFSDPTSCSTTVEFPTPPGTNTICGVRCIVTDSQGALSQQNCRVLLHFFPNTPPTCVTSGDVTVFATGGSVTVPVDGCASFDPDPNQTLTFDWDGCPQATFDDETACATNVTIDLTNVTLPYTCGIRLIVKDGLQTSPVICRINVTVLAGPDCDICPSACPNGVDLSGNVGNLRAALVGSSGFDVTQVDLQSLSWSRKDGVGSAATPTLFKVLDTSTPAYLDACECQVLGADGIDDLLMALTRTDLANAFQLLNEPPGTSVELVLDGQLLDGTPFSVSDCVLIR